MFDIVSCRQDIDQVVDIARIIWTEHYTPIIGIEQVEYMLSNFQSAETITEQISTGSYQYYLIKNSSEVVGYIGLQLKAEEVFLSKIYVLTSQRGTGIGKLSMQFIKALATKYNLPKISLTVNKYNSDSIAAYYKFGFIKTAEVCTDIGQGYVMDDIVMVLTV
ncbi:GNAT family N-acetyltransferase [Thalassotalea sp. ND16A]|uniref:GNAT family N-acetyltransferase n=1 Tax=Thalassotalea sp. ND16A TaxID=1535422 RepID=UPI00051A7123|nr:GNAT family N-acetyltransferase [Thalassotalea sp. ND16A]KGJ99213.1 hypothetical protein ND16A_0363 [Thalassotalea sp. ND16A]